jgi:hypothetical protein
MAMDMQTYIATTDFMLGATGLKISKNSEVRFDGVNAFIDGAAAGEVPQLKSVINAGWIKPVGSDATYRPPSSEIKVSPNTPEKGTQKVKFQTAAIQTDSQVVGNFRDRGNLRGTVVENGQTAVVTKLPSKNVGPIGEVRERTLVSTQTASKVDSIIRSKEDNSAAMMRDVSSVVEREGITLHNTNAGSGERKGFVRSNHITTPDEATVVATISKRGPSMSVAPEVVPVVSEVVTTPRRGRPKKVVAAPVVTETVTVAKRGRPKKVVSAVEEVKTAKMIKITLKKSSSEPESVPSVKGHAGRKPNIDTANVACAMKLDPGFFTTWDFYATMQSKTDRIDSFIRDDLKFSESTLLALYMAETEQFKKYLKKVYPSTFA